MTQPLPPRNAHLLAWTSIWTLAAIGWTALSTMFVLSSDTLMRWLLFSGHAKYLLGVAMVLMLLWPTLRQQLGERLVRVYLLTASSLFGVFGALLVFALKEQGFLAVVGLATLSFLAMALFGMMVPLNLRKPRRVLEVLRQVAEITLAGVALGPELGWVETGLVMLGLAAAMVIIGDDVQTLGDDSRIVPRDQIQRIATQRATDLYLSYFRLTLVFTQLLNRRKRRPR